MMNIVSSLLPINRGRVVSQQESAAAINQVSSNFEKVYTSINKLNSSVSEGSEQISVQTAALKKKFQELKKIQQAGNIPTDAAAKNTEMIKLHEKIRSLKAQGKKDEVSEWEKKLKEVNEQFGNLMSPEAAQVQKSATCRNIVGIVDNLGQIMFRTVSDQFAVRDSIKSYLISSIDAKRLACGNRAKKADAEKNDENKEKEEKGTLERMSLALLKNAGVFLQFAKQMGVDFPKEYESDIKITEIIPGGGSIADTLQHIDARVRHMNTTSRSERIDALLVDELLKEVDEVVEGGKAIESMMNLNGKSVQQAVAESQAAIHVAEYETNPASFKIPPVRSVDEVIAKLKTLVKVLHEYLVPSLVATPLVFLQDKSWGLKSHSEFRTARRKELNDLLPHISANMPLDALRECLTEFIQTFILVLHVKIPAMPDVFPNDSTILNRVKWAPERKVMRTNLETELEKLQNPKTRNTPAAICVVAQNLVREMMRFLTYKPVGRPHVFKTDAEWTLVSESKLRFQLRKELLI